MINAQAYAQHLKWLQKIDQKIVQKNNQFLALKN